MFKSSFICFSLVNCNVVYLCKCGQLFLDFHCAACAGSRCTDNKQRTDEEGEIREAGKGKNIGDKWVDNDAAKASFRRRREVEGC